jgi:membrane protein DedA with SNARE-associated domain
MLHTFAAHGYVVLFVAVFLDQLSVCLPSPAVVIVMGCLARAGKYDFCSALAVACIAASMADIPWYAAGRCSAPVILNRIGGCDCLRKFENREASIRNLVRALLFVKFTPVPTLFVPLWAGARGIPLRPFVLLDMFINLLWALSFLVIGYAIEREISTLHEDSAWIFCAALIVVSYVPRLRNYWKRLLSQGVRRQRSQSVWDRVRSGV